MSRVFNHVYIQQICITHEYCHRQDDTDLKKTTQFHNCILNGIIKIG